MALENVYLHYKCYNIIDNIFFRTNSFNFVHYEREKRSRLKAQLRKERKIRQNVIGQKMEKGNKFLYPYHDLEGLGR